MTPRGGGGSFSRPQKGSGGGAGRRGGWVVTPGAPTPPGAPACGGGEVRLGVTAWSARLLADHLGISYASVARIWREWKLQPWRRETFKFSTDPQLEANIGDGVGLYLNPPDKAVVLSSMRSPRFRLWTHAA